MTIDETTIKFLNMKIERMHQEIEYWMGENSKHKNKIVEANKILDEIKVNGEEDGGTWVSWVDRNEFERLRQCLSQEPMEKQK
jgi:hypothetical protein